MKTEQEISNDIFYLTEENMYKMISNLNETVDKSLVYCFIKALYIHALKLYLIEYQKNLNFDEIYNEYKELLKKYYTTNNPNIENDLLDQILNFFDNSFALIESVEFTEIQDSYEFRHHVIKVFELLRIILENKSKAQIRENIFENYTRFVVNDCEQICDYVIKN